MWWHGTNGWGWWWMGIVMAIFWGAIAAGVVALARGAWRHEHSAGDDEKPEEILARRFARGEITREQFEDGKRLLAG